MTVQVILTGDGSSSLFHNGTGEHYHSTFGAITESMHVFIQNGFNALDAGTDPVHVLEIGFGTGLNAFLTLIEAQKQHRRVVYDAFEPFPPGPSITRLLNYPSLIGGPEGNVHFNLLHESTTDQRNQITQGFLLKKITAKLEDTALAGSEYHLVYFDAFSPNVQPELWQPGIFQKLFVAMKEGGILSTYCAKGAVSRNLKDVGFAVAKLGGPPGKRHILQARRNFVG